METKPYATVVPQRLTDDSIVYDVIVRDPYNPDDPGYILIAVDEHGAQALSTAINQHTLDISTNR